MDDENQNDFVSIEEQRKKLARDRSIHLTKARIMELEDKLLQLKIDERSVLIEITKNKEALSKLV